MHIPDGFVSVPVAGATGLASVAALFIAFEHRKKLLVSVVRPYWD